MWSLDLRLWRIWRGRIFSPTAFAECDLDGASGRANSVASGFEPRLMESRRRSAGYVMICGLLVAVGMYAVACGRYYVSTRGLAALQKQCLELLHHWPPKQGRVSVVGSPDPKKLCALPSDDTTPVAVLHDDDFVPDDFVPDNGFNWPSGDDIRAAIKNVYQERQTGWDNISWWAFVVGLLSSIPRIWYFMLGRIVELSTAIRGR
jgi:hypothetical protein